MKKKYLLGIAISILVIQLLSGCENEEKITVPKKVADEGLEIIKNEGVYLGQFVPNAIDIEVKGVKKMINIPEILKPSLNGIQPEDDIEIEYVKDEKGELILTSIKKKDEKTSYLDSENKKDETTGGKENAKKKQFQTTV